MELTDGRILYVYTRFTGTSTSDYSPAQLVGRYFSDKGQTWTNDDQLIVDKEGDINVMSVSLMRIQNGSVALFYLRKNSREDCIPIMRLYNNEGETWSDPVACISDRQGYFVVNNVRIIQLNSGGILMPTSMHKTDGQPYSNKGVLRTWSSAVNESKGYDVYSG